MSTYQDKPELKQAPLGKTTEYISEYTPELLYPVPRKLNRDALNLDSSQPMPFFGQDVWYGYELSWLNNKGKPQVALARFVFACENTNIIESKSFKLYLNSLNQTRFNNIEQVQQTLQQDLAKTADGTVEVTLFGPNQLQAFAPTALPGECIDDLDIECNDYEFDAQKLNQAWDGDDEVTETLYSHLLKSNCLITSQPDWGSVVIEYQGRRIKREALLRYLISFRQHNEFHEQCVERIYCDIKQLLQPKQLRVGAYYTRRGGLDISPWRSSDNTPPPSLRTNRQ